MKTMVELQTRLSQLQNNEEGASMVEYGLLVSLIALVAAVGVGALGIALNGLFGGIAAGL